MRIKLFKDTLLPVKSYETDCALDIFIPETFEIQRFETKTIGLGFGVRIPEGFAGMLVPRSSISKKGFIIQTSIIDQGYTGEIQLILTNCSMSDAVIEKNQRVCSIVVYSILNPRIEIVTEFEETDRNDSRLGSSGV